MTDATTYDRRQETSLLLDIPELCCQQDKILLEKKVGALRGILDFDVNVVAQRLRVDYDSSRVTPQDIIRSISETGMKAIAAEQLSQLRFAWWKERRIHLLALSGALAGTAFLLSLGDTGKLTVSGIYLLAIIAGAYYPARAGLSAARTFSMNINTLLIIGVIGALGLDLWAEASVLVFVYSLGNVLESFVVKKARGAIKSFVDLMPKEACVVRDGGEVMVKTNDLKIGDLVRVRPGEKIPVDGTVSEGESFVDQSAVTGEPMPRRREPGDSVFAGTLNQNGVMTLRVTRKHRDTTLARIIHSVEQAQAKKSTYQLFGERFAGIYTPAMFFLGIGVAVLSPLVFGMSWNDSIYRGLVVFVVSCSCGLALSVPVAIVAAVGNAARHGILMKGGLFLEKTQKIRVVAFDKTGTLTVGRPMVVDIFTADGFSEDDILSLASSIESFSEHPIGQAIVRKSRESDVFSPRNIDGFEALPGRGVRATVDGAELWLGNAHLLKDHGIDVDPVRDILDELETRACTPVIMANRQGPLGVFAIADATKKESASAIEDLRQLDVSVAMLTGDAEGTAKAIGRELRVDDIRYELLPEEKIEAVRSLRAERGPVMMVGDGINDSPAMAVSDVGVAMGAAGTDVAMETGDIVLLADDLTRVAQVIKLGKRTVTNIQQNIFFSLLVVALLVPAALAGRVDLLAGLLLNEGAALLVILNGLRLTR